jgi:hypothetical protein
VRNVSVINVLQRYFRAGGIADDEGKTGDEAIAYRIGGVSHYSGNRSGRLGIVDRLNTWNLGAALCYTSESIAAW